MQEQTKQSEAEDTLPWLVFEICGIRYAVASNRVGSILQLPDNVCPVPEASPLVRGIFDLRGEVISLLDLRKVFGYRSMLEEYRSFVEMLEARKADHVHWVQELERSVKAGTDFTLATDPRQCAFGKWYSQYHSEIDSVNMLLGRIDEPHRLLHEAALDVARCQKHCESCQREECLKVALKRAQDDYAPMVLRLLEEAKEVFRKSFQELVIVLEDDGTQMGVIVDDVLAVDQIEPVQNGELSQAYKTNFIAGMGVCEAVPGNILLLDEEKLLRIF